MVKEGESSFSRQVYPGEVAYAPATPAKSGGSDPNLISPNWLLSQFDGRVFEETPAKKRLSCDLGSSSHVYEMNSGMYKGFSMDDLNSISCKDLLALADATSRRGSGGGGGGGGRTCMQFWDLNQSYGSEFDISNSTNSPGYGYLHLITDLNLPPEPVCTPDEARRVEVASDNNKERSNLDEQPQQLIVEQSQSQAGVSTLVEANQETNLTETPQPKQRRRKHRPKVVKEGQPKRAKKPRTPTQTPKPDGSSTGKRKYVRRKGVENATQTPPVIEEVVDPSTDQQTKKSCKRKINFDEPEQVVEANQTTLESQSPNPITPSKTELPQGRSIKTVIDLTLDNTCSTTPVVETNQTILESQSVNPITPSKTELPQGRSIKNGKRPYNRKVKCQINFLEETHDKESNCSTGACFNNGEEAQGSQQQLSKKTNGMDLWVEKQMEFHYKFMETYLSKYTDYSAGSTQGMHVPAIYKRKRIDKCQTSVATSSMGCAQDSDCSLLAKQNAGKAPEMSKIFGLKDDQQPCKEKLDHSKKRGKKRIEKCQSSVTTSSVCCAQDSGGGLLAEQNASIAPQMSNICGSKDDQQPCIYKESLDLSKKKRGRKRVDKCQTSVTTSSMYSTLDSGCSLLAEQSGSQAPPMSKPCDLKVDHRHYKEKRSKDLALVYGSASFAGLTDGRLLQTPKRASRYEVSPPQHTYAEAHGAGFQVSIVTKNQMEKNSMVPSLYHDHLHRGFNPNLRCKSIYEMDALVHQFEQLNINSHVAQGRDALTPYLPGYHEKNALVLYQQGGSLVPYEGVFNPVKKRKPRPKVDLDDETSRVWRLLLENINSEGIDGTDEDKAKWWEEERRVFRGRADSFIARMHLVQGDRRFSRWKGSVLDSVVGVFLTQNVSDHLSSSAFMSLASRYPLKPTSSSEPLQEEHPILSVKEPCEMDEDETIKWHEEQSNQPAGDDVPMMLQDTDSCEEKEAVSSNDFSKNGDLNVYSECEVTESSEKSLAKYKESVVDQIEVDDVVSSQNSADMSPSSVQSSIIHTTREEEKDKPKATVLGGYTSFVELLHMQGATKEHETYSQQADESSNKKIGQDGLDGLAYLEERNDGVSPDSNNTQHTLSPKEHDASEESGLSAESASQATVQMVKTTSSQEGANTLLTGLLERFHHEVIAENPKINTERRTENSNHEVQEVLDLATVSAEKSKATKSKNPLKNSGGAGQKVVEFNSNDQGSHQMVKGMDEGSSKAKRENIKKVKQIKVEWDNLRLQAEVKQKRETTPNTRDSLDYEAVRNANVDEVADAIKERGMNNVLAGRIKDVLDRLVRDHGSMDLEWLRDVPPDKAKEYLLSFRGLGLKSVECIRLLTLHHLAFPVDTNVGRIAVRLGWVPLQPLPESLQLHLLELYPVLESIQKYLWPRLCKLDQRTLYELHYQMITFGKVFCTKSKPNCNACPMRGECRHFASAFASARLALPAAEESVARLTENRTGQGPIGMIDQRHPTLPPGSEQLQLSGVRNCNPGIEEPATPGPTIEVPTTPVPTIEVPTTPGPIVEVPSTPGPIIELPSTPGPIVEVPASPEPEQVQQEDFDMEDFGEDTEEIPMIKLNIEEFTQNLQTYMEKHMVLEEGDMSKALVALTSEAASIPTPKLKNVSQLRTEHQVYELPDSHPLLEGLDTREPDDPCSYLLAIWTPGETADSIQPPEGQCSSQESGILCNEETCFFCNSTREANSQTVRGTLLIPCRTATRGSFPLNGTYFQVNEVFADHDSSLNPIEVPRSWLWNLPRRTVYFGTSIPTIFKGLTTEDIQYCFWRGFVCVRGFDLKTRAPRPLMARLHFPASRLKRTKAKTDEK